MAALLPGQKNFADLELEVRDYLFGNSANTVGQNTWPDQARIQRLLNDKQREICSGKEYWFLYDQATFNTVANTFRYELAPAVSKVMDLTIPARFFKLQFLPRAQYDVIYPGGQGQVSPAMPLGYIMAPPAGTGGTNQNASQIDLFPTPDQVYTMSYWYRKRTDQISGTQNIPIIPPEWQDILVHGALFEGFAMISGEAEPRVAYHRDIYNRRLRELWMENESNLDWMNTLRSFDVENAPSMYPGLVRPYLG